MSAKKNGKIGLEVGKNRVVDVRQLEKIGLSMYDINTV